ncbi:MAG: hypothetical protein Q4A41_02390 [Bacillota bacterium]|nr:hypothetical protein [Bacillota bacterium]
MLEKAIIGVWLVILGLLCIRKSVSLFLKEKKLKDFLEDAENVKCVPGKVRVVKIDYLSHFLMKDYIVEIVFETLKSEIISIIRSVNASLCSTRLLKKSLGNEVAVSVFCRTDNPYEYIIKELKELEYCRMKKWLFLFIGLLLILTGFLFFVK